MQCHFITAQLNCDSVKSRNFWKPPIVGFYKINVVGSFYKGKDVSGIGVVIQDDNGLF